MIWTGLSLIFAWFFMAQVVAWPPGRKPQGITFQKGYYGYRPFQCCVVCGDNYALTVDRCMHDPFNVIPKIYHPISGRVHPNKMVAFNAEHADIFMAVPRLCCALCDTNKMEFVYSEEKGQCIRQTEMVSTLITVDDQYCNLCLFLTAHTLFNNNYETILPYDIKKCNSFYSDKELCIKFLQQHYDEIAKTGLSSTPSKICHEYGYCHAKGTESIGLLPEALAKLRSGEAKVIAQPLP